MTMVIAPLPPAPDYATMLMVLCHQHHGTAGVDLGANHRHAGGLSHSTNPTTPLSLAFCLSALPMREIRLVIAPLDPGHEGEDLLNRRHA